MNLFEIDSEIQSCFDDEGCCIDVDRLDALCMAQDAKVEAICLWVKDLRAEIDALKREEKSLYERRKADERKAESLTKYLANAVGGQKFSSPRYQLTWRTSHPLVITGDVPDEYTYEHVERHVNKEEIKLAIQSGEPITWAYIDTARNSIIR